MGLKVRAERLSASLRKVFLTSILETEVACGPLCKDSLKIRRDCCPCEAVSPAYRLSRLPSK